ncbi:hypothetical protein [Luteimonas aquatica]|uniref:hypothetical protein n=1 Tax=Luteimonas aquatica TaxID=450364 RepID=UPI001F564438|nr:hypothetical protein [Luteimonas aquatica]
MRSSIITGLLLGSCGFAAHAEAGNCTAIDTLPATIGTPGLYCLDQNLATAIVSGNAITINTDNVTIDCNGRSIDGSAAGPGTVAFGIRAQNRADVTIRHCSIRGFYIGLQLGNTDNSNSQGHLVEHNHVDASTMVGIDVQGWGSIVRANQVTDTGGRPSVGTAKGIFVQGNGLVANNLVSGVKPAADSSWGNPVGIHAVSGPFEVVDNRILGVVTIGSNGTANGILAWMGPSENVSSYRNNTIINSGATPGYGIYIDTGNKSVCRGNTVANYANGLAACFDGGGNVSR